jgi:hypothetical protein
MPQPVTWGSEIPVTTSSGRELPAGIATNKNGVSLIVWESASQIFGQMVDPFGRMVGSTVQISTNIAGTEYTAPSVTALASGDFAVAYLHKSISLFPLVGLAGQTLAQNGALIGAQDRSYDTVGDRVVGTTSITQVADGSIVSASNFSYFDVSTTNLYSNAIGITVRQPNGLSSSSNNTKKIQIVYRKSQVEASPGIIDIAPGADGGAVVSYTIQNPTTGLPSASQTFLTGGVAIYSGPTASLSFTRDLAIAAGDPGTTTLIGSVDFLGKRIYSANLTSTGAMVDASVVAIDTIGMGSAVASVDVATIRRPGQSTGYVATWDTRGATYDVVARSVIPGETTTDFIVHTGTTGEQYHGQVAVLPDGRMVFAYASGPGPAYNDTQVDIRAQIWDGRPQVITGPDDGATLVGRPNGMTFANDVINGGTGNDVIYGLSGHDTLSGGRGNDTLIGAEGTDIAKFAGSRMQYQIAKMGSGFEVRDLTVNRDGTDTLTEIERMQFSDGILAFDTAGIAGQVYRLYQAAFARTPDTPGLSHNIRLVDNGLTLQQMSSAFIGSAEFQQKYGTNVTDTAYINALYRNVLGRDADPVGLEGWQARLNDGSWTRTTLLIGFSESPENINLLASQIANGILMV